MKKRTTRYIKFNVLMLTAAIMCIFSAISPRQISAASAPSPDIFENSSETNSFKTELISAKNKLKRDLFYTTSEMEIISQMNAPLRENVSASQEQKVATQTAAAEEVKREVNEQPPAEPKSTASTSAADTDQVEFKVEGIIKIGNRGCAIINSKLWFVGKEEMGYVLHKLNTEAETVEIKTPTGRVITRGLEKPKKNKK